jgi:hypothetical protein
VRKRALREAVPPASEASDACEAREALESRRVRVKLLMPEAEAADGAFVLAFETPDGVVDRIPEGVVDRIPDGGDRIPDGVGDKIPDGVGDNPENGVLVLVLRAADGDDESPAGVVPTPAPINPEGDGMGAGVPVLAAISSYTAGVQRARL